MFRAESSLTDSRARAASALRAAKAGVATADARAIESVKRLSDGGTESALTLFSDTSDAIVLAPEATAETAAGAAAPCATARLEAATSADGFDLGSERAESAIGILASASTRRSGGACSATADGVGAFGC